MSFNLFNDCRECRALLLSGVASVIVAPSTALAQNASNSAFTEEIIVEARKRPETAQDVPIAITAFSARSLDARGIVQTDQIAQFTPNLTFQNNPGSGGATNVSAIYIRGVGQFDFLGSIEPGVGLYVDGVYLARSVGGIMDLVDVEQISVLRGPQGTLFGRNTIGGAIDIQSVKPSDELGGKASVLFGDDQRIEVRASANLPITDTLFVRISSAFLQRDGYVERVNGNGSNGTDLGNKDTIVGRVQVRWEPTERFTADFSIDATKDESNGAPYVIRGARGTSNIFNPNNLPIAPPGTPPAEGIYVLNPPFDAPVDNFSVLANYLSSFPPPGAGAPSGCLQFGVPYTGFGSGPQCFGPQVFEENLGQFRNASTDVSGSDSTIWGASLDLNYDFDSFSIRSITAYRSIDSEFAFDQDGSPLRIAYLTDIFKQEQISQEVQVKGSSFEDRLNWIVGGFFFKEDVDNQNDVFFTPFAARSGGIIENQSLAFFGQGTFDVTDRLSITAGLRWTKDDKSFDSDPYQFLLSSNVGPGFAGGFDTCPGAQTAAECPPDFNPAVDTLLPGQPPIPDADPSNGPLTIFNNRQGEQNAEELNVYANIAYDITDDVLAYFTFSQGFKSGGFTQRTLPPLPNVPTVGPETVDSFEAGFKSTLFDGLLRLNIAGFYNDYDNIQVQGFTPENAVAPVYFNLSSGATIIGFEVEHAWFLPNGWFVEGGIGYTDAEYEEDGFPADFLIGVTADSEFERVSKWVITAGVQKTIDLGEAGTLTPRVDWAYRSKFFNDAANTKEVAQPGYSIFNTTIQWADEEDRFSFLFGVNNIFAKDYIISSNFNANQPVFTVLPNRGREWYARLGVNF